MDSQDLNALLEMSPPAIVSSAPAQNHIRLDALKEIAVGVGARGGLSWRYKVIMGDVERNASSMDSIFDFRHLLISAPRKDVQASGYTLLPPVITEATSQYELSGKSMIRAADKVYRIDSQARFVTTPPTWRDYVERSFPPIEPPHPTLLPKNDDERSAWKKWVLEGWGMGVSQADAIFLDGVSRLKRDYEGMVRYRILLKQNMISSPFVAQGNLGVTGGGDSMAVDERIIQITSMPSLNKKASDWKPLVRLPSE